MSKTGAGIVKVELDVWTVPMLREEVAKRYKMSPTPSIICTVKIFKDDNGTQKLSQFDLKNNAKVLASRVAAERVKSLSKELLAEEERSKRLARVNRAAAAAISKRHADCTLQFKDQIIGFEDQSGQQVELGTETDQRDVKY